MIRKDSPEPVVPSYVGTSRLEEPADTRRRSWERVDPDSEESEDDVVYDGEGESELQRTNLRNEVTNQITVDACGEQCAQLDDFNWFLPTDEWYGKSDAPESEIDTSYRGNGVHIITSDSSSSEMYTMSQRLSSPPPPPKWSLRRDIKGAVRQQCPGESAGCRVSGRRTVLQRWIQDRSPSPQVHWILRGYIKSQNVSQRGSLSWKQLLRLA